MDDTKAPNPVGLYRAKEFAERHRSVLGGEAALRWLIFCASTNGLEEAGAILRFGRRVLIDEAKFFAWLRSRAAAQAVPTRRSRASRTAGAAEGVPGVALAARSGGDE